MDDRVVEMLVLWGAGKRGKVDCDEDEDGHTSIDEKCRHTRVEVKMYKERSNTTMCQRQSMRDDGGNSLFSRGMLDM